MTTTKEHLEKCIFQEKRAIETYYKLMDRVRKQSEVQIDEYLQKIKESNQMVEDCIRELSAK